jgi:hypothetical protein
MTPQEAAGLAVAVIDALCAAAETELTRKRAEAEAAFKAAIDGTGFRAAAGAMQVDIPLPDGRVIGHLSVKAGTKTSETNETGLHEWVAERNPEALEEYALPEAAADDRVLDLLLEKCPDLIGVHLTPGALEDPRVLDLLRSEHPELMSSRVRPGSLKAYVREAAKTTDDAPKGWLFDPETGERLQLVTETLEAPSGAFAFNGAETAERRKQVMAALAAGDPVVRSIAFGAVGALGPAGADLAALTREAP